ncbi:hypothetical protein H6503_06665 [Candidatus Woesearchaeota archaeon]|nr:hypothetical protein [Candidatus Woesearchaeota archaeon]
MKKSQISLFSLLGIIVVILLISFILIQFTSKVIDGQVQQADELSTISDPVERYVTLCLHDIAYDAIIEMGEHGGFTDLDRLGLKIDPNDPLESDAVVMSLTGSSDASSSLYAIPYYFHMTSPNQCSDDCTFRLTYPELYKESGALSIESELDYFIDENLGKCINNFNDFTESGYNITILGEPKVDSSVNDETISFSLEYPLEIIQDNRVYKLERYQTHHNINIGKIMEMALDVAVTEARYRFLEYHALNLISGYAGLDNELPPVADSTFEFGSPGKIWAKSQVEKTMKDILIKYVNDIRVIGSRNYVDIGDDSFTRKLFDNQMRIYLSQNYTDLDIYFNYLPIWPIYFDLNCEGEICKAESFSSSLLTILGTQRYRFYYTMSYPVMVKIHDPDAFDGEGFNYFFFLESNVYNNDVRAPGSGNGDGLISGASLMCNENQRNSGEYSFNMTDAKTLEQLKDVIVQFNCGDESCNMEIAKDGTFNGSFPICAGGAIVLQKEGFMKRSIYATTVLDEGEDLGEIMLEPLRRVNITVNKLKFVKPTTGNLSRWIPAGQSTLKSGQDATIIITPVGDSDYLQLISIEGSEKGYAELAPGEYNIDVYLKDNNDIIIPEEEREEKALGGLISEKYTVPEIRFNSSSPWSLGGLNGSYVLGDIDDGDTITINVIALEMGEVPEIQRKIEDMEIMGQLGDYLDYYKNDLGFR